MKATLIFALLVILSATAYCQSRNSISLVYAATPNFVDIHSVAGDFGYSDESGNTIGLNYQRYFTKAFSLQTGLFYSYDKDQLTYIGYKGVAGYTNGDIKMISIPVLANFTFFRYLFIDGGLTTDFQTNYTSASAAPNQSGVGYEFGIGAKYTFKQVTFFVNPFFQKHNVITFNPAVSNFNLFDSGFKLGLGYNF